MLQAEKAYDHVQLQRASDKGFRFQKDFKAWGGEVLGGTGIVGDSRQHR